MKPTNNCETIHLQLPQLAKPTILDAFLDKVNYCCDAIVACRVDDAQPAAVELDVQPDRADEVRDKVRRFCTELARGAFPLRTETVVDYRQRRKARPGIVAELLDRRWLVPYSQGCIGLQGPALALYEYLEGVSLEIARGLKAAEASFPALMELAALEEANYLDSFPHHLTMATPVMGDVDKIKAFVGAVQDESGDMLASCSQPTHVLAPTVCIHAYRAMRKRKLHPGELICLTANGHCFRHERNRLDFAGRLWNFRMRELIFVGSPEDVQERKSATLAATGAWLDDLGMAYALETASDPFFVTGHAAQSFFQLTNRTKVELRMQVESREIAVGSFNYHRDHFGKAFQITQSNSQAAHSACVGFGLERLVLAFFAQLGTDVQTWPSPLRDSVCQNNLDCF